MGIHAAPMLLWQLAFPEGPQRVERVFAAQEHHLSLYPPHQQADPSDDEDHACQLCAQQIENPLNSVSCPSIRTRLRDPLLRVRCIFVH
jgi:hypothetical protein